MIVGSPTSQAYGYPKTSFFRVLQARVDPQQYAINDGDYLNVQQLCAQMRSNSGMVAGATEEQNREDPGHDQVRNDPREDEDEEEREDEGGHRSLPPVPGGGRRGKAVASSRVLFSFPNDCGVQTTECTT